MNFGKFEYSLSVCSQAGHEKGEKWESRRELNRSGMQDRATLSRSCVANQPREPSGNNVRFGNTPDYECFQAVSGDVGAGAWVESDWKAIENGGRRAERG